MPGIRTVATAATAIQRGATLALESRGLHAFTESSRQRRHQERDRREQQQVRRPSGHEQAPERVRLDGRSRGEALHDQEGTEPPAEQRRHRSASHANDGDEASERRPLRQPRAPEELAQVVHLLAPVVEVELEVAVELEIERQRIRCPPRASSARARTRAPHPALAPSRSSRTRSAGTIAAPHASPSRQRRATTYASRAPAATSRFGGLSAAAAPIKDAGEHAHRSLGQGRANGRRKAPQRGRAPSRGSPPLP